MKTNTIQMECVDAAPDRLESGVLYVSFEYETAIHACCCGCGNEVVTPLSGKRAWRLDTVGGPTLEPSIGNDNLPCRSHYFIRKGRVVWL